MPSTLLIAALAGCGPTLAPGEWGAFRYFGDILGEPPMRLLPPLTDRDGNVYVLYGAADRQDTQVFVGRLEGGWSGGCSAHRGLYGLHGFVGRSQDRVWYWSGTALVEVDGNTGACNQILRDDPVSGTELSFLGIAPTIDETPSRRFAYGLIQGATGQPSFLMVDLDEALPFNTVPYAEDPPNDLRVVATGAWKAQRLSVFVVAAGSEVKAHFVDRLGQPVSEAPLDLPSSVEAYHVPSFLQFSDAGVGAGIDINGDVVIASTDGGGVATVGFDAHGILAWEGQLYVTGLDGGEPVLSQILADASFGDVVPFAAAGVAEQILESAIVVNDERGQPTRVREWEAPRTAIGDHPMLSPWPLDPYTLWSTGWLVAGPGFNSGVEPVTAVAFAPVGLEVP